mmetsp:Transcript_29276/g.64773  ORF Transcript_29276/g.64773 Transcript_29276/m.64773 type:complete len:331 (-) Transcript_29276:543-1535(-)
MVIACTRWTLRWMHRALTLLSVPLGRCSSRLSRLTGTTCTTFISSVTPLSRKEPSVQTATSTGTVGTRVVLMGTTPSPVSRGSSCISCSFRLVYLIMVMEGPSRAWPSLWWVILKHSAMIVPSLFSFSPSLSPFSASALPLLPPSRSRLFFFCFPIRPSLLPSRDVLKGGRSVRRSNTVPLRGVVSTGRSIGVLGPSWVREAGLCRTLPAPLSAVDCLRSLCLADALPCGLFGALGGPASVPMIGEGGISGEPVPRGDRRGREAPTRGNPPWDPCPLVLGLRYERIMGESSLPTMNMDVRQCTGECRGPECAMVGDCDLDECCRACSCRL